MSDCKFKFELKLKGSEKVFREGMPPGVLASHIADFSGMPEEDRRVFLPRSIHQHRLRFLDELVEVVISPASEEDIRKHNDESDAARQQRRGDGDEENEEIW